jgi:predicted XRE-type DNA-binding protein
MARTTKGDVKLKREVIDGIEVTHGSGNVYADLGLPDAEEMHIKAAIAYNIHKTIEKRKLTQTAAAKIIGVKQPELSNILRGRFRGVSIGRMLIFLNRLGHDVQITIRPARRSTKASRTTVVAA